jgi:SAM-dependent methyltransferase
MSDKSKSDRVFDDDPMRYEVLVDWPRRLAREEPFYRRLFDSVGVERVLDVACGTGHHAEMFHSWGLAVEGADASEAMIEHCRARLGESDTLRWVVRSFAEPCDRVGEFDAAICVGNSLALAEDMSIVEKAVGAMLGSLRPGGVCLIHVLNLWRLDEGSVYWQKQMRVSDERGDRVVLKGVHRVGARGFVEFGEVDLDGAGQFDSSTILAIEADELRAMAAAAGGCEFQFFGGYNNEPYGRATSVDLIMACRRDG